MTVTVTISYTASASEVVIDSESGGSRSFGPPAEIVRGDLKTRDPVAWAAAQEFNLNGTTSANVVVTAN